MVVWYKSIVSNSRNGGCGFGVRQSGGEQWCLPWADWLTKKGSERPLAQRGWPSFGRVRSGRGSPVLTM